MFPDGHGLMVDGTEVWTANIHLLRTEGVANGSQGVKDCIECMWAPSKEAPRRHPPPPLAAIIFFLLYTV